MIVEELDALDSANFVRRWFLPYLTRGVLHRWSPSLWLRDPRERDTQRMVPQMLRGDLEQYSYEFELPTSRDVEFLDRRREARAPGSPDLIRANILGEDTLLLFDPKSIADVLERSPNVFGPATAKSRSMRYFAPDAVIVSSGKAFEERRKFQESALKPGVRPGSDAKAAFLEIIAGEIDRRIDEERDRLQGKPLDWAFMDMWPRARSR